MQDNIINANDQSYNHQDQSQSSEDQPPAQSYAETFNKPVLQTVPQPYIQPYVQQNLAQPNNQLYIYQTSNQQYLTQEVPQTNNIEESKEEVDRVFENFKQKFFCSKVISWIIFVLSFINYTYLLMSIPEYILSLLQIIHILCSFFTAYLLKQSINNRRVKRYIITIILCLICVLIDYFHLSVDIYLLRESKLTKISWPAVFFFIIEIVLGTVLFIILICYKKEFNKLSTSENQQTTDTPKLL